MFRDRVLGIVEGWERYRYSSSRVLPDRSGWGIPKRKNSPEPMGGGAIEDLQYFRRGRFEADIDAGAPVTDAFAIVRRGRIDRPAVVGLARWLEEQWKNEVGLRSSGR